MEDLCSISGTQLSDPCLPAKPHIDLRQLGDPNFPHLPPSQPLNLSWDSSFKSA